jgi:hypothetical protein
MDRPKQIVWFEWISFGSLVLGAVNTWLAWPELVAAMQGSIATLLTVQGSTVVLLSALYLWISRGRSNVGKWILTVLFIVGLPFTIMAHFAGPISSFGWVSLVQTMAQIAALALLFTRDARAWFKGEPRYEGVFD